MTTAPAYIAQRFLRRFVDFVFHWYAGSTRVFWRRVSRAPIAFRFLFMRPEGKRPSSYLFWMAKALLGTFLYLIAGVVSFLLYAVWLLLPPFALFRTINGAFL